MCVRERERERVREGGREGVRVWGVLEGRVLEGHAGCAWFKVQSSGFGV